MKRPEPDDITDVVPKSETPGAGALREMDADLRKAYADCALVVTPHPMTLAGQQFYSTRQAALVPGETLAQLLARHGVLPDEQWVVALGGIDVPQAQWTRMRPKAGHLIEARRVPQDQDTLRMAGFIALMYFTMGAGGIGGGSFLGLTGGAGYAAAGAAFIGGSLLINKVLPPKAPGFADRGGLANETSYSLSGGRNRMRPFEPMSLVLGQPYCVPDLAAQPYTYFANGEQYLWQLFHAGINCASVDTLRIGQTPIANYQNVNLSYEGFASGNTGLPLLSNVDVVAGALLDAPASPGAWVTRTSSVNTIELAVDLEGSVFSVNTSSGAYESLTCVVEIEYRLVGDPSWTPLYVTPPTTTVVEGHFEYPPFSSPEDPTKIWVDGYTTTYTPTGLEITNASTKPVRLTYRLQVAAGQYEVRARKVTANTASTSQQNTVSWTTLKSYQLDAGNYKGQARLGIQIQASGQLNGSLDEVNWIATANPMPYWDGAAWVTATSRANGLSNPGAQLLLLARGIYDVDGRLLAGHGFADAQIDIEGLKGFMVWCAAKGFFFDYHLQQVMSIGDLQEAIAGAGMGAISWHTGKFGVIWFADDQPVESVMNMGTMKVKSFSVDYDVQATADELEVQYFDRARGYAWKSLRVLAPGVATPVNTARQPLLGVTDEAHAAILARFYMAQNIYQRKTVTSGTDLEHLTFRRGTVIALSHDLTQWGYGGRVQAAVNVAGTVTLTLDDVVPAVSPTGATTRYMGLRIPGESQYRIFPIVNFTVNGASRTLTLASAWPGGVAVPGDSADNPAHDTIWIYDFKATPGQKLRVASIEPQGNMGGARVALVPESAEFWTYVWTGAYTPPPNTSLLQGAPVVTAVTVTEQLERQGGTYYTELTASISVTGSFDSAELWGAIGTGPKRLLDSTRDTRLSWRGGIDDVWLLEIRPFSTIQPGTPYTLEYSVKGLRLPPAAVGAVTVTPVDGQLEADWPDNADIDLGGYEVRAADADWGTQAYLYRGRASECTLTPPAAGTTGLAYIKAWDTSKNYSVNATLITFTAANVPNPADITHSFGSSATIATITIDWADAAPQLGLRGYEVSYDAVTKKVDASTITLPADWVGNRDFTVKTVDLRGNKSAGVVYQVTKLAPNSPINFAGYAIDNNAVFSWTPPAKTTLPISHYLLKRDGVAVGRTDKAFDNYTESESGTHTYELLAVDTDSRESAPAATMLTVFQPPDYILAKDWVSDYSGTKSNAIVEAGALVLPVNTTQTFADHFTANGWTTPQQQVDAGFALFIQPGATTGYYEEIFDYGATLASMSVSVLYSLETLAGVLSSEATITVAQDAGFTTGVQTYYGNRAQASNFRYVKVRVTVTATDNQGVGRIAAGGLTTTLDAKLRTEQGVASMTLGGAHAQRNIAQDYKTLWVPGMAMPPAGFTLNGTTNENKIVSAAGPSGISEPVWACVDYDVASDGDGGWNAAAVAADCSKGHLFAVCMRTSTNNGDSYFGTDQDSTILDLSGAVNANPYFLNGGDLPALNTWHLVVGYLHEIGYGTTDTNIAGVYNLAGTRLVAGTEFKAASGKTSISHRAYHNYNPTGSLAEVQWMARPVVIPCTVAEAPNIITYLLKCAKEYGARVPLPADIVDVASINLTAYGDTPTSAKADFYDIPNPKSFNIFNWNGASLVAGDVAYIVRRY